MNRTRILFAALAAALLALPATAADGPQLTVDKLVIRAPAPKGDSAANHKIVIRGQFDIDSSIENDVQEQDVVITVDGVDVFALRGTEDRDRFKESKPLRWRFRGRRSAGRPRLKLDLSTRTFKLKARGLDLTPIADGTHTDIEVTLQLGETVWFGLVNIARKGKKLKLAPRTTPPPDDDGGGGGRGDAPLRVTPIVSGYSFSALSAENVVIRTEREWAALWSRVGERGAAPRIDFTTEMVVAVSLGPRPTPAHSVAIDSATATSEGVAVAFTETVRTRGVFPTVIVSPYSIARTPIRSGRVTFSGRLVRVP